MALQSSFSIVAILAGVICLASGAFDAQCSQRYTNDFRQDETDCRRFYVCYLGRLVPYACNPGSVFHEGSGSCVPANSQYDTCSIRQQCRAAGPGAVAHPSQCNQYYDCGTGPSQGRNGRDLELRECPHPLVFSDRERKCVAAAAGVCGRRQEPLDACDYRENQCDGHARCVPCNVRFPSCRGLPDGLNAWNGREGSPYYVICHQQRVVESGMCEQKQAVFIFDSKSRSCVKQEELIPGRLPYAGTGPVSIQTHPAQHLVLPPGFLPLSAPHADQAGSSSVIQAQNRSSAGTQGQIDPSNVPMHARKLNASEARDLRINLGSSRVIFILISSRANPSETLLPYKIVAPVIPCVYWSKTQVCNPKKKGVTKSMFLIQLSGDAGHDNSNKCNKRSVTPVPA